MKNVEVTDNVFLNWSPSTYNGSGAVVNWATYSPATLDVSGNDFLDIGKVALAVSIDGKMSAAQNWFGTTDVTIINAVITDRNDDLQLPSIIAHTPDLTALSTTTTGRVGTTGGDQLAADAKHAILLALDGDDVLISSSGSNVLIGGNGNDTASYQSAAQGVVASLDTGPVATPGSTPPLFVFATSHEGSAIDLLLGIENLRGGAFADQLTGDGGINRLEGGGGDDILMGGDGADVLDGGAGYDIASYENSGGAIAVDLGLGTHTGPGATGDTYLSIEGVRGSGFSDILTGSSGDNVIEGGAGDDILEGGAGVDTVSYAGAASSVSVSLTLTVPQATGGAGIDTLTGFENIVGSAFGDTLVGDAGANRLEGGAGNDVISPGLGADQILGGDGDDTIRFNAIQYTTQNLPAGQIDGGAGYDTVDLRFVSPVTVGTLSGGVLGMHVGSQTYTLTNIELILQGSANDTDFLPDNQKTPIEVRAGEGNDTLFGSGAYKLFGEGGDDRFFVSGTFGQPTSGLVDGGTGRDRLETNIGFTVDLAAGTATAFSALYQISNVEDVRAITAGYTSTILGDDNANTFDVSTISDDGHAGITFDGRGGNDTLTGSAGADTLTGGTGNDVLSGSGGNDVLEGGAGDDMLDGETGIDTASYASAAFAVSVALTLAGPQATGGAGIDTLTGFENLIGSAFDDGLIGDAGANMLAGGGGSDVLAGGVGDDTLYGQDGNDTLFGEIGNDTLLGDLGNDTLFGQDGNDVLQGNEGDDTTVGGAGNDALYGQDGNDVLWGETGDDTLAGGNGDDLLYGQDGSDTLFGEAGNDNLQGGIGNDTLYGQDGNDILQGGDGEDMLVGGAGDDGLYGDAGNDTLFGEAGNDALAGGAGNDLLYGQDGNDALFGQDGDDLLLGNDGTDLLAGGNGNDALYGNDGADTLFGEVGSDSLFGGNGNDALYGQDDGDVLQGEAGQDVLDGGAGNDFLIGGADSDQLIGGSGSDAFFFTASADAPDAVYDFNHNEGDWLGFQASVFGVAAGTHLVDGVSFLTGAGVTSVAATPTFYFDTTTRALWFDADGTGADPAHVEAFLLNTPALSAADFYFI
ncbi:hypothetical protein [Sphingomonas sp. YR710]|uniref:calcium-binding protein n=1 Tax=Sphingomonas sp. YR710 TaxID=1882773 RepID=UPI0015A05314|nr:hypothetical protein [Sphingomonas sp. YR710]